MRETILKKSKLKEDRIEKIRKYYEFTWERFKFKGFGQLLMFLPITIIIIVIFFIVIAALKKETSIPIEVLILIVLGIQAFFMLLQTGFFQTQNKFLKIQAAPQLIPYAHPSSIVGEIELIVKNTRVSEAHNVRYSIDIFDPKRKNLKKDSIGTVTNANQEYLLEISQKDFKKKKMIINFYYEDVMSIPYTIRFLKKENSETILFVGFI